MEYYLKPDLILHGIIFLTFPIHWAILIAASLVVVVPALAVRHLVKKLVLTIYPAWGSMVSVTDGIVGEDCVTGKPNAVLTMVGLLDGSPALEEIQDKVYRTTIMARGKDTGKILFPKFQQYTERWLGYSFWKWDTNFKIENHIRSLSPDNKNATLTEEELKRVLGVLQNQGFKAKHPHWEILYVKNFIPLEQSLDEFGKPIRKSLLIYRIHHGIGDGYSILKCSLAYMCQDTLDIVHVVREKKRNTLMQMWNSFYQLAMIPYFLFRQLVIDIDSNVWFLKPKNLAHESHVSFTKNIPISILKEIRKQHGVSLTSVLYAALGGAIGKYFQKKYGPNKVPNLIRSFTPLPWKNHPMNELTNHWTCAVIPILTSIACPSERLVKCEEEVNRVKGSSSPLSNYMSTRMVGTLPGWAIELFARNWYSTCILSNFPGPLRPTKYLGKYPMEYVYFITPHLRGNAGVGIGIASYAQHVRFTLNFDKAIIPLKRDLDELTQMIEEEVQIMYKGHVQNEKAFPVAELNNNTIAFDNNQMTSRPSAEF